MPHGAKTIEADESKVTPSIGNVFADLNVPNPAEALLKAKLAMNIARVIRQNEWTQMDAASAMGIDQPKVSAILRGKLREFSIERLIRLLHKMGQEVHISVTNATSGKKERAFARGHAKKPKPAQKV
jgi:predicted XRE-type DNA-binding protein